MTCRRCRKLFSEYLDGDLSAHGSLRFRDHLAGCDRCAEELARFKNVITLTASLSPVQPSPDFDKVLRAKLADSKGVSWLGLPFERRAVALLGAICLLLAAATGTYIYGISRKSRQGEGAPPQILVGREAAPVVYSRAGDNILANFVMPNVHIIKSHRSEPGSVGVAIQEDWQDYRTFVLPVITGKDAAQDDTDTNYVLKRFSVISTSDGTGL